MRLIVVDTNVIVSAGIRRSGAPARLVLDWVLEKRTQVICCPSVIAEYRGVALRQKFRRYGFPPDWLESLIEASLQLPEPGSWPLKCPDAKDSQFLSLAKTSGAWLVTGNLKHFPESVCDGVRVISPSDYLEMLEN